MRVDTGNPEETGNQVVGGREERFRHLDAERLGGREVDHQFELGRLHDRQVGGLGALEDVAGIDARLTKTVGDVGSVTYQPTCCDVITLRIGRRNPVVRRQGGQLHAAAGEESVASDEEGIGTLAREGGKGRIDLADRRGVEDMDLQPEGTGNFLHASQCSLGVCRIGRIDQHGNTNSLGHQLMQESQPLGDQLQDEKIGAGRVAARPREAGDKTKLDRVFSDGEHGIVAVAALAASAGAPPGVAMTATRRRTRSAISAGRPSYSPSSQWYSIVTFWRST
jgi:hypothetical protein